MQAQPISTQVSSVLPPLPQPVNQMQPQQEVLTIEQKLESAVTILQNPSDPNYLSALRTWGDYFITKEPLEFFKVIYFILQQASTVQPEVLGTTLKILKEYSSKSMAILNTFIESNLLYYLPFQSKDKVVTDPIFTLLFYITQTKPDFFTKDFLKLCNPLVLVNPFKMLRITQELCKLFDRLDNPWPGADFLFRESMPFIESEAVSSYLSLLVQMLLNHQKFYEARFGNATQILLYGLTHANVDGVHSIYSCISAFFNEKLVIMPSTLEEHINGEFESDVISYLLRDRISPRTPKLIEELIKRAPTNSSALAILIADATRADNVEAFKPFLPNILSSELRIDQKLIIMMSLLLHEQMRQYVVNACILPGFIKDLLAVKKTDFFDSASLILIKIINVPGFTEQLAVGDLMPIYCDSITHQKHRSAVRLGLYAIDVLARAGLADKLIPTISWAASRAVSGNYNVIFALSALASIGSTPAGAAALSQSALIPNLQTLSANPQTKAYVDVISSEMTRN